MNDISKRGLDNTTTKEDTAAAEKSNQNCWKVFATSRTRSVL